MEPGRTGVEGEDPAGISLAGGERSLTHLDQSGGARMVDVGDKEATDRRARARARVRMSPETAGRIEAGDLPKGDVTAVVRLAGIGAAKRAGELIPLAHPLGLDHVGVELRVDAAGGTAVIEAEARTVGRTGVEMEAMTAAAVAALALYDMVKGVDREVVIEEVALLEKSGGRSGNWKRPE